MVAGMLSQGLNRARSPLLMRPPLLARKIGMPGRTALEQGETGHCGGTAGLAQ